MKTFSIKCVHGLVLFMTLTVLLPLQAEDFRTSSKITQVVGSVNAQTGGSAAHPAALEESIVPGDILTTGSESRAELTSTDETVIRVGANSIFSFSDQSRQMILNQGSVLFHTPHGEGGGMIKTAAVTAAVTGSTVMMTTTSNGGAKVAPLESPCFVTGKDHRLISRLFPGQLLVMMPGGKPFVVPIDLGAFTKSSGLIHNFPKALAQAILSKVVENVNKQNRLISQRTNVYLVDSRTLSSPNPIPDPYQVLEQAAVPGTGQQLNESTGLTQSFNFASLFPSYNFTPSSLVTALNTPINLDSYPIQDQEELESLASSSGVDIFIGNNIAFTGVPSNSYNGAAGDPSAANLSGFQSDNILILYAAGNFTFTTSNPNNEYFSFINSPSSLEIYANGTLTIDGSQLPGANSINLNSDATDFVLDSGGDMILNNVCIHSMNANANGDIETLAGGNATLTNTMFTTMGSVIIAANSNLSMAGNNTLSGPGSGSPSSITIESLSGNVSLTGTLATGSYGTGPLSISAGNTLNITNCNFNLSPYQTNSLTANTIYLSNVNFGYSQSLSLNYANYNTSGNGVNFNGMIIPGDLNVNTGGSGVQYRGYTWSGSVSSITASGATLGQN